MELELWSIWSLLNRLPEQLWKLWKFHFHQFHPPVDLFFYFNFSCCRQRSYQGWDQKIFFPVPFLQMSHCHMNPSCWWLLGFCIHQINSAATATKDTALITPSLKGGAHWAKFKQCPALTAFSPAYWWQSGSWKVKPWQMQDVTSSMCMRNQESKHMCELISTIWTISVLHGVQALLWHRQIRLTLGQICVILYLSFFALAALGLWSSSVLREATQPLSPHIHPWRPRHCPVSLMRAMTQDLET